MAFTFGFYNSINHDRRYDAVQVGQIFDGIIKDGVYETYKKAMMVKESLDSGNNVKDNEVIVQPGRAWFNHTWSYNDANLPITMPAPETFNMRIDAVVLDINSANATRKNSIIVVKGTPAPNSPSKPAMANTTEHHQYPLAYITRKGNEPKIYTWDIENAVGTDACPFVIGCMEMLSAEDLIAQWQAEFDHWNQDKQQEFLTWMIHQKESWEANIEHNEIAWNNWFSEKQDQLDGDVAGHLQEQIDEIAKFAHIYVVEKTLYLPMSACSIEDKKLIITTGV